jgi:xylulokinase
MAKLIGDDPYNLIVQQAKSAPAGCEGLCFLPYLTGERTPHADPLAKGCFVGIQPRVTKGYMARAVIEGVAYSLRQCIEIFRELKVPVNEVRVMGGGAKNMFWNQMIADTFSQSTCGLVAAEGAAYGVALLAAVGTKGFKNVEEACAATVRTCDRVKPKARSAAAYNRYYPVWKDLYPSLKEDFAKLAEAHG